MLSSEFCEISRTSFLQNTAGRLLLKLIINWEVHLLSCSFSKFLIQRLQFGWLAHLVSRFACNTRVIVDASSKSTRLPCQNRSNSNLESTHRVNKKTLQHQPINQMVIRLGGKSHRVAVW